MKHPLGRLGCVALAILLAGVHDARSQEPERSSAQIREFLRSAEVIAADQTSTGITQPWRLTLTDGMLTHDAAFQSVERRQRVRQVGAGRELGFVDSYHYNIAAYELAALLGLGDMVPVTVERRWNGRVGALSWWIDDVRFDEATRLAEGRRPDDIAAWSGQLARMQVFTELVQDTDRNQTNLLYTSDWALHMIDFSRAFRLSDELRRPADLTRIDRWLFERLRTLTDAEVAQATSSHLTDDEVAAVLDRRDRLVEHFQQLIETNGEPRVFGSSQ